MSKKAQKIAARIAQVIDLAEKNRRPGASLELLQQIRARAARDAASQDELGRSRGASTAQD